MSTQLNRLKEKSIQFSLPLVQKRLSDDLMHDLVDANNAFKEIEILFKEVETKEELRKLKEFLEQIESKIPKDLFDTCTEEFKEIAEDFKWSNSKKGRLMLALESWVVNARSRITKDFKEVFIGRDYHEPTSLIISGITENELQEEKLKETIHQLNPSTLPKFIIERPNNENRRLFGFIDS